MAAIKLTYLQILDHLEVLDRYLHFKYKDFSFPQKSLYGASAFAKEMMRHVGLGDYNPIVTYAKTAYGTAGHICLNNNADKNVYITLSDDKNRPIESELATLAHEICHKLLYVHGCYFPNMKDYNEVLTDLATIYVGFGRLTLKGCKVSSVKTENVWSYSGLQTQTTTTTHYTGYLDLQTFITAYSIVGYVNNIPIQSLTKDLKNSISHQLFQNDVANNKTVTELFKEFRERKLSIDALSMNVIIQLETVLERLKQRIQKRQVQYIKTLSSVKFQDDEVTNSYKALLIMQEKNFSTPFSILDKQDSKYLKPLQRILTRYNKDPEISASLLDVICPCCGYRKEKAISEHKITLIRCPKCNNVFMWDATQKASLLNRIKNVFKRRH